MIIQRDNYTGIPINTTRLIEKAFASLSNLDEETSVKLLICQDFLKDLTSHIPFPRDVVSVDGSKWLKHRGPDYFWLDPDSKTLPGVARRILRSGGDGNLRSCADNILYNFSGNEKLEGTGKK